MSLNEWQLSGLDVSSWNDRNWGGSGTAAFVSAMTAEFL
jgi:hypothetical protein